ncbi:MAG: pyridoxal-dependent decarboxylase [Acidimicrobiaceae bacterium]|nr:pyridoxal-dependent decarboxylase [Acidimicrobiaceae bacterium]
MSEPFQGHTPGLLADRPSRALDLEEFRSNGHLLVDWIADYLKDLGERPVCEPTAPGDVRAQLPRRAPEQPEPFSEVLSDLEQVIVPALAHWQHPGWFAYFPAMSSPASVLGELAAAGLGVQGMMWSSSPALTELEAHVLDWLVDLMGLPQGWKTSAAGGGTLTSGASSSTHIAMVAARETCRGRTGAPIEQMVVYTSGQSHSSVEKGARIAGFGHIRLLDTDHDFAVKPGALNSAICQDRRLGLTPASVISALGTTGTTAVDPIAHMGDIATRERLWHHVDAAYAGSAMICEEFRHHLAGVELADSYTFNPHKWLATNLDCSVLWVADRKPLIDAMSIEPPYLRNSASDSGQVIDYRNWGVSLGRPFRALKLWFVLRDHGAEGLRQLIRNHRTWAEDLSTRIDNHSSLTLIAPTTFALVSFAHVDGDAATRALAQTINDSGRFFVTVSESDTGAYIRIAIGSTWTSRRHIDSLWRFIEANALQTAETPTRERH